MATIDKNFRIKNGLAVEGSVATVNGNQILTENASDTYILNLIGGETLVKSVASGLSVDQAGELSINRTVVDGWYDESGAASAAQAAAESYADGLASNYDPAGSAQGAYDNAVTYANALDTDDIAEGSTNKYFTNQRALDATSAAYDPAGSAATAQSNAEDYANTAISNLNLSTTYDAYGAASQAETNANNYTDGAINGLGGNATAVVDGNLDVLTGTGIVVNNNAIEVDFTELDTHYDAYGAAGNAQSAAQSYTDTAATNAENAAKQYADDLINDASTTSTNTWSAYKTSTEIGLAQAAAEQHADDAVAALVDGAPALLNTLNELAAAIADNPNYATDVANLVAGKQDTLTAGSNIDITGSTISVTGLDTADVAEDSSRLYFTDTRAKNAVSAALGDGIEYVDGAFDVQVGTGLEIDVNNAVKINRTTVDAWYDAAGDAADAQAAAETTAQNALNDVLDGTTPFTDLNINDVAKQVAARTTSLGSVVVTAYQFNKSAFKSGKFLVKIDNGTHNEISEILVTLDSSDNVAITEYAIVGTNGTRGTITADVDATHCRIRVNPVNDSTITVSGTVFNA